MADSGTKAAKAGLAYTDMDIFDFSLQPDEMELIDMMNINCRLRYDPDTVDFTKC